MQSDNSCGQEMDSDRFTIIIIINYCSNNNIANMLRRRGIITAMILITCAFAVTEAFNCKFPNEGCEDSGECCSGKCIDAHPGTNPRCTKLGLHKPCLYTYQCEDRLRCGSNNTCCAKYWGICTEARDCCDKQHHCYEVEGFYYRRCLYSSTMNRGGAVCPTYTSLTLVLCLMMSLACSRWRIR